MNRLEIQALTRFVERMASRDVTGLPKIGQGTPYDSARNAQRRADDTRLMVPAICETDTVTARSA